MNQSGYLSCGEIEALRYGILSADLSELNPSDKQKIKEINSYLIEELSLCSSSRRIDFSVDELELLDTVVDDKYNIESISDIKKIREEVQ